MKKRILYIVLAVLVILVAIGIVMYIETGKQIFNQFTAIQTREDTIESRKEYIDKFNKLASKYEKEDLVIESRHGDHDIPAVLIKKEGNENYAILAHGMGGTKESMYPQIRILIEEGYNCLSIDMRQSGENKAVYNTGGVLESDDILDGIKYLKTITDRPILAFGESFGGAATTLAFTKEPKSFGYIILDCPVSDGRYYLENIAREMNIPIDFFLSAGDRVYKNKLGFSLSEMDTVDKIHKHISPDVHVPILILNSHRDIVTPYYMGEDLYNAIPYKEKMIISSSISPHAMIVQNEPEPYKTAIQKFFEKYENQ